MKRLLLIAPLFFAGCGDASKPTTTPAGPPSFDENRSFGLLKELCLIGPRNHGSDTKEKAEKWIQDHLRAAGAEVSVHAFDHMAKDATAMSKFRNIVARFRPAEPRRILLGTHYDTRSWADRDKNPELRIYPINGANDGGSGVAVLIELARIFKEEPPPVGVDMIFFDGEDFGREGVWTDYFLGSRAWVRDHPDYKVEWGVILDMVGDAHLRIPIEADSGQRAPDVVRRLWEAVKKVGAPAFESEMGAKIHDDHTAFLDKGIPVALLIDFEYPFFHTDDDTPEQCSPQSLGQVGRVVLEAVRRAGQ